MLHLNRTAWTRFGQPFKVEAHVQLPAILDLADHCMDMGMGMEAVDGNKDEDAAGGNGNSSGGEGRLNGGKRKLKLLYQLHAVVQHEG